MQLDAIKAGKNLVEKTIDEVTLILSGFLRVSHREKSYPSQKVEWHSMAQYCSCTVFSSLAMSGGISRVYLV